MKQQLVRAACRDCGSRPTSKEDLVDGRCEACTHKGMVREWVQEAEEVLHGLAAADDWVAVSLKATGVDERAEVVQIAIVNPAGELLMNQLVRPSTPIQYRAWKVHGIRDEHVAGAPVFADVYPALVEHLAGRRALTYGADYQARVLRQTLAQYELPFFEMREWYCMRILMARHFGKWSDWWGDFVRVSLVKACARRGVTPGPVKAHRAAGEAWLTWRLLQTLRE